MPKATDHLRDEANPDCDPDLADAIDATPGAVFADSVEAAREVVKPYLYLDRYAGGGKSSPAITRNMPTDAGSHVRLAVHGIGDGRSLEFYVQANGHWFVESGPGPMASGERVVLARGRLPVDGEPEVRP
jgi:hypothetical protein